MRQLLAITDVTEMGGDQVCIAGVTEEFECIRPVIDGGVRIWSLYKLRKPVIYPSAKVWMDLSPTATAPPHIEDHTFVPASVDYKDHFEPRHWELLLSRISFGSVSEVFDGKLEGRRVAPGTQTRSLGTIKNVEILELHSDSRYDKLALRIDFRDESGAVYEGWPVNDLAFRGMFNELSGGGANLQSAARDQLNRVRNAGRVYLRLGLTRPVSVGGYPELCWSQVTGVYTFPDYLDGRTWADFR